VDASSPLLFEFACHYECPGKPDGAAIEWDTSAAVYADDVNLLGHNINTIKKSTEALIDAEVGLKVNAEETKYMLMSRHQNAGQNHDMKRANRFFEYVAQFKYL
jgi:site-specific DNA-adenine methylase